MNNLLLTQKYPGLKSPSLTSAILCTTITRKLTTVHPTSQAWLLLHKSPAVWIEVLSSRHLQERLNATHSKSFCQLLSVPLPEKDAALTLFISSLSSRRLNNPVLNLGEEGAEGERATSLSRVQVILLQGGRRLSKFAKESLILFYFSIKLTSEERQEKKIF